MSGAVGGIGGAAPPVAADNAGEVSPQAWNAATAGTGIRNAAAEAQLNSTLAEGVQYMGMNMLSPLMLQMSQTILDSGNGDGSS